MFKQVANAGRWGEHDVATPDGRKLVVVNTTTGSLYLIDARPGTTSMIDLSGETLICITTPHFLNGDMWGWVVVK